MTELPTSNQLSHMGAIDELSELCGNLYTNMKISSAEDDRFGELLNIIEAGLPDETPPLTSKEQLHWHDPAAALRELAPCEVIPEGLRPLMLQAADELDEIERLREALQIIAGQRQCADSLMGNVDVARAALGSPVETTEIIRLQRDNDRLRERLRKRYDDCPCVGDPDFPTQDRCEECKADQRTLAEVRPALKADVKCVCVGTYPSKDCACCGGTGRCKSSYCRAAQKTEPALVLADRATCSEHGANWDDHCMERYWLMGDDAEAKKTHD